MITTILNVFPGDSDENRLVLARETNQTGETQLVLRQESRSPHVGWFVQSRIVMDPNQVVALKMTLTSNLLKESAPREETSEILRFGTAMAG